MSHTDLSIVRARIDKIDTEIQNLIMQRAELAQEVAKAKRAEDPNPYFYRPERETEVLNKAKQRNHGVLPDASVVVIFREIMSACLALQKPLSIAFLGPEGTYSQAAVLKHFGHAINAVPLPTIESVFANIEAGNSDYGMVPVENSTEGGVNQTLQCLLKTPLRICGEVDLAIHHNLLAQTFELQNIQRVYSHQQSLGQCRSWLDSHLPHVERIAVNSNAEAARRAVAEPDSAAIAGQIAADTYHLSIVAPNIEDNPNNTTRFVVLGKQMVQATGKDKTSLVIGAVHSNQPGTLFHVLKPFADHQINMTRIESHPSRQGIWHYLFFIDIEGHEQNPAVSRALDELAAHTSFIKRLGSYPCAIA